MKAKWLKEESLDQKAKEKMFNEDFERESAKDFIYLQEEERLLMKEINEEENRLPAKIYILGELPSKLKEDEAECNTLPF